MLQGSSGLLLYLALRDLLRLLPRLLLLLLLLLQQQVLLEEESEGGAVDAIVAAQPRHHLERSVPRGVPHGAVTPLRPGVKETRSPWGGVVCSFSQGHSDGHPLVAMPLTEPSLSPPRCGARSDANSHGRHLKAQK